MVSLKKDLYEDNMPYLQKSTLFVILPSTEKWVIVSSHHLIRHHEIPHVDDTLNSSIGMVQLVAWIALFDNHYITQKTFLYSLNAFKINIAIS